MKRIELTKIVYDYCRIKPAALPRLESMMFGDGLALTTNSFYRGLNTVYWGVGLYEQNSLKQDL